MVSRKINAAGLLFGMVALGGYWDSTVLRALWGAAFGATIGISVSSGAWFEVLFVALLGIFLAMVGTYVVDQWVADSSPEPAAAN